MSHEPLPGWRRWGLNVLLALDQFGNALFGGSPDETVSSRSGRAWHAKHVWGRWLCRGLNWLDPGHCDHAIESELKGTHQAPALRSPLTPEERQAVLDRLKRLKRQDG